MVVLLASTKEYRDFILDELSLLDHITYRSMMGEYLLYYDGIYFGGICDDRFLVKIVNSNQKYNMKETLPYEGAKLMYLVDDIRDKELLKEIVLDTCRDLQTKK